MAVTEGLDEVSPVAYREQRAALLARRDLTGAQRRGLLADLTDAWLAGLLVAADPGPGVALAAVGGLGRRDLAPQGDLDLVLLHEPGREIADVAAALWYPVWDSGVSLDHAVRTLAETRSVARDDVRAVLGLLDLRHVAGDAELTTKVRAAVLADFRATAFVRLPQALVHARQRARRAGLLAQLLEPDVKEAAGGLRDLQLLRAASASWLADVPWPSLAGPRERLLDIRDALHLATGRESSRLTHQDQGEVAGMLGYPDPDALLRAVSAAGRTIRHVVEVTARQVSRAVSARDRHRGGRAGVPAPWRPLAAGVVEREGEVSFDHRADPVNDALLVLRLATAAARGRLPLSPGAVRRLGDASVPALPWPTAARDLFLSLLGSGDGLVSAWEALDEVGYVHRLLPEWDAVRHLPQRNPVHRHTVDRHSIEVVVEGARLGRRVARPDLLLLAGLCHDLGKGVDGPDGDVRHPESGVAPAVAVCERLGLDEADTTTIATLVRHHLLLATTATRRDPSDPLTVATVRDAVGDPETLDLLHALTEADARATGPLAWSGWRAACVGDLVARVHAALKGVVPHAPPLLQPERGDETLLASGRVHVRARRGPYGTTLTVIAPDRLGLLATEAGLLFCHRQSVRSAVTRTIGRGAITIWETSAPDEAALDPASLAAVLAADLERALSGESDVPTRVAARARAESAVRTVAGRACPPGVRAVPRASSRATVLEVRADDAPGLLYRAARLLSDEGLDIVAARVSTFGHQVVDVFFVLGPSGVPLAEEQAHAVAARVQGGLRLP